MANKTVATVLQDGDRNVVVLATGVLDTGNVATEILIDVSALAPAATALQIKSLQWSISNSMQVILSFDATTDFEIACMAGQGSLDCCKFGGIPDRRAAGYTGDVLIRTEGHTGGGVVHCYTIIIEADKL